MQKELNYGTYNTFQNLVKTVKYSGPSLTTDSMGPGTGPHVLITESIHFAMGVICSSI